MFNSTHATIRLENQKNLKRSTTRMLRVKITSVPIKMVDFTVQFEAFRFSQAFRYRCKRMKKGSLVPIHRHISLHIKPLTSGDRKLEETEDTSVRAQIATCSFIFIIDISLIILCYSKSVNNSFWHLSNFKDINIFISKTLTYSFNPFLEWRNSLHVRNATVSRLMFYEHLNVSWKPRKYR